MVSLLHILVFMPCFLLPLIVGFFLAARRTNSALTALKEKKRTVLIAIMAPSKITVILEFLRPFIAYIKKYASFEFEIIECINNLNREKAIEWAEFINESNVDLIVSMGNFSTEIMYGTLKNSHHKTPLISAGSPVGYNEVPFETMQMTTPMTAVSTQLDWPAKVHLFKKILPHAKTVLVIFSSIDDISHFNLREKNAITTSLRKYHTGWRMHHVPNIHASTDLTPQIMEGVDIIFLSRSSEVLRYASRISDEAQRFNVPVLSPDTTCEDIFIGISECPERAIGIQSAKYAIEIIEDGVYPSHLPLKEIKDREKVTIYPHRGSPMLATTAIGNLLTQSNVISLSLKEQEESKG